MLHRYIAFLSLGLCVVTFPSRVSSASSDVSVSAAISLKDALEEIARDYKSQTGEAVNLSFGSSGQLAAQIKAGAPAELFISADRAHVEELERAGLIVSGSQAVLVTNKLVLIAPRDSKVVPAKMEDLLDARYQRIAIGEPRTVPAGAYAMQSLRSAGVAEKIKDRLVLGLNVRQVLEYVRRGETDAGLVYRSDAIAAGDAVKVGPIVGGHEPIEYWMASLKAAGDQAAARRFINYLSGADARQTFTRFGFDLPIAASPTTSAAPR